MDLHDSVLFNFYVLEFIKVLFLYKFQFYINSIKALSEI